MIKKKISDVKSSDVEMKGALKVKKQILIGKDDGSNDIIMRLFTVGPGGNTPLHTHNFEHLVKIEKGEAVVVDSDGEHNVSEGSVVYVKPNEMHQFLNRSDGDLQFICVIPAQD